MVQQQQYQNVARPMIGNSGAVYGSKIVTATALKLEARCNTQDFMYYCDNPPESMRQRYTLL